MYTEWDTRHRAKIAFNEMHLYNENAIIRKEARSSIVSSSAQIVISTKGEIYPTNRYRNWIFYNIKPLIPRSVQLFFRRALARHKRKRVGTIWPIDPLAGKMPKNWPGWPDRSKFALVLSHDVDTEKGQGRALDLARLEMKLGFRSAFNFVPESYVNDPEVKAQLRANGFEINVHGLRHDGKLFRSRKIFEQRAVRINKYLKEWGARGFTSPSMLCRANWLHRLDITHSLSTFDTDPFEPQPDSVGSIFPFWVGNGQSSKNYVELPYSLPQDHLLFVILKEKTIDIWKRKLDWVASCGGMALLNTHSDYMNFDGTKLSNEEYPVGLYIEFLQYVNSAYTQKYYHATPSEVADYVKQAYPCSSSQRFPGTSD
jgi:hypothetical protein